MSETPEFLFLTVEQVLALHRVSIATEGGSDGIRDFAVLESAVMAPQATFGGELLHKTVEEIGAAYLYYLCQNHPFVDGNKRAAARAALVFLDAHGFELKATIDELEALVLGVASSQLDKPAIVTWLRAHARKTAT